ARAGLAAIASELETRPDGLAVLRTRPPTHEPLPPPRLLGQFDPLLLGWASRADIVGDHAGIVTTNGLFRPFALVDGKAAGIWRSRDSQVGLEPFGRLAPETRAALDADAADVRRFFARPS